MSSECFRFHCLSVEGNTARFKMLSFEDERPVNKSFYLELLLEFFDNALNGHFYDDDYGSVGVLSEEDYQAKAESSPVRARLESLYLLRNGGKVPVSAAQLAEWKADSKAYDAKYNVKTNGGGGSGKSCFVRTKGDEQGFVVVAQDEILAVNPIYLGRPNTDDDRGGIWSEVEFQVADADMLAHLVPGTVWGSAMYELNDEAYLEMQAEE